MLINSKHESYTKGDIIFSEGDVGDCAYLIEDGIVDIYATVNGQEQLINQIGKGDIFGEVALLDHQPRTATARAQDNVVLIPVQRNMMNELLDKTDPIVRHVLLVILERFRNKRGISQQQSVAQQANQTDVDRKRNSIQGEATQKLTMVRDIRKALSNNEFEMYYQPICELSSGHVAGYEALIRWHHPSHGLVSPCDFLWLAEQTGQIREIGLWALERSCRDWAILRKSTNFALPFIGVNVSPSQLMSESFVDDVKTIIGRYQIQPCELKLELTETVIIENPDIALHKLNQLTELGCKLAIDDFGTGHSTLDTLNRYPVGTIKIDMSFIRTILTSSRSEEIVNSSIRLAHSLGMKVVAEGIETDAVRRKLIELGCNFGQGWLFGKPAELKSISALHETSQLETKNCSIC